MPKISKHSYRVNADWLTADVMYSSSHGFYMKLPDMFKRTCQVMENSVKKDYCISWKRKTARDYENGYFVIMANSETAVKELFNHAIRYLVSVSVEKRPVIIIQSKIDETQFSFPVSETLNTSCALGVCYAIEIEISGKKTYETARGTKLNMWTCDHFCIIPDTPAHREKLEYLINALTTINTALGELLTDSEGLIKQLKAHTKLLPLS